MADQMSERDELTLRTLAFIERTTLAEQRRRALAAYAKQARRNKNVADIVGHMLASRKSRRERQSRDSNVVQLRGRRSG
jgi:hypothetical protein